MNAINKKNKSAYVVLISVLLIGAIATSIAVSILFFGANSSNMGMVMEKSIKAKALANACAEDVLVKIKNNNTLSETNTSTIENAQCVYTIDYLSDEERNITIKLTLDDIIKRMQISINQITPTINVTSWKEVADFE